MANKQDFETIVLPQYLTNHVLKLAHNELGHNGSTRTYKMLKRLYYWKGLVVLLQKYKWQGRTCQQSNRQRVKYANLHFYIPSIPMQFILIDYLLNVIQSPQQEM